MKRISKFNWLILSFLIIAAFSSSVFSQPESGEVELVAVGDVFFDRGVRTKIEQYGVGYPFEKVGDMLSTADVAFANLENPIAEDCDPAQKKYQFRASPRHATSIRNAGLDVVSIANNHTLDCGRKGLIQTIEFLDLNEISYAGVYHPDGGGSGVAKIRKNGISIGFAAFTAIPTIPGKIPGPELLRAEPSEVTRALKALRAEVDVVVASIHWGTEYSSSPTKRQRSLAHVAAEAGADLVLGHHPHVLQGFETLTTDKGRKALIAYSLGNFVFDSPTRVNKLLKESLVLKLKLTEYGVSEAEIIPVKIEGYRPHPASKMESARILDRVSRMSADLGTSVDGSRVVLDSVMPISEMTADLDGDGIPERVILDHNAEKTLKIFHGNQAVWEAVPKGWKPWKLDFADVDGDGRREIVVGVFKPTKFFPKPHNCLFVYGWNGESGFPKWLGSSLSRPFTDFVFLDTDNHPGEELVALERALDGTRRVAVYHWDSFGYTRLRDFGSWNKAKGLILKQGMIEFVGDGKRVSLDVSKKGEEKK
ncbi:MAG: hypothetical protein HKN33_10440 [Pyrinomonadaceae bacterium]|nr:hypothetical protein [Pyrinomonadaceae bacterium]